MQDLGWDASWEDAFEPYNRDGLVPARVAVRHHGPMELLTELGRLGGITAGKLGDDELPAVGDWVAARPLEGERKALIEAVLPRRSAFTRKEASRRTAEQVVAANVDVVFLVSAFGRDLNPRRIERYLTAAWESGASPVIVLNKADLSDDPQFDAAPIEAVAVGRARADAERSHRRGARRARGPARARAGRPRCSARPASASPRSSTASQAASCWPRRRCARGTSAGGTRRRTASSSFCPKAADCSSTRRGCASCSSGPTSRRSTRRSARSPTSSAECRFADCSHEREPGCAIQAALADGTLDRGRWESYRKLQRELRALEIRQNGRLRAEEKRKRRVFARSMRTTKY